MERKCNCLNKEFVSLKRKKQCFESGIKSLKKIADNFAKRGEKELIITFITKSNCLEDSLKKKKKKVLEKPIAWGTGETLTLVNLSTLFNKLQAFHPHKNLILSQEPSFLTTPLPSLCIRKQARRNKHGT